MKFYNKTPTNLEVKDVGGAVQLGPFLPGTADKGPWYDVGEIPGYLQKWQDEGKIRVVE